MQTRQTLGALIADCINEKSERIAVQWARPSGTATRHFWIDDLLPDDICQAVYDAFPTKPEIWFRRDTFRERKKTFAKMKQIDPLIGEITMAFQEPAVLDAVGRVTGIAGLEGDPLLYASGISMMEAGDFLNPHIDNSHDMTRERYRRLNLLYYVAPDWQSESGGNFELWDDRVRAPVEIVSRCNRLLVMETTRTSWHSVNPVRADARRCCVSNYFFSAQSLSGSDYYHVTSFLGRPGQPLRRLWGRVDNWLRQTVASTLRISRGKGLINK